jgi:hypothetical protein
MNSRQVWPQLGTQATVRHPASQPLLTVYEGCEGTFGSLALGPLAAPMQLRTMFDCGGGDCTLHTGTYDSTSATQKDDWKNRDKDETDCCSWGTVKYAFCDCNPFLCWYNTIHFIF